MTRLNVLAIVFLFSGALVGLLLRGLIAPGNDTVAVLIAATTMTLLDLGYRLRNDDFNGRPKWISMKAGAYLAFFPLWGWGLALIVVALVQLVTGQEII
jgi:multisubunit Na+/H+ antiporter MnhB subunit